MDVPAYRQFLPDPLLRRLWSDADAVPAVPGLRVAAGLRASFPDILTDEALELVVEVYRETRETLSRVLEQRRIDRAFVDQRTLALVPANEGVHYESGRYATVIGQADASGRVVVGPAPEPAEVRPVDVPEWLRGEQITLFGPPDTARLSINAMNALHRKRPGEPAIVAELVEASGQVPRWGADDEDSKTPIMASFLRACENLIGCFDGTLRFDDPERNRTYAITADRRSRPIKRVPGLAIPDGSHLLDGEPLPLHLLDLVLHVWHNRARPEALAIYFPKLENEEEAAYLAELLRTTEEAVRRRFPAYPGTVRVLVVFENPRAIFRIREITAALHPYFLGGSLGWHDFLASTARLFRHDPQYRIPVKADPNIVINNIRESHRILVRDLGPSGALKLGGMYGVLFEEGDPASFQVAMTGFIRDVITQLRRGLDGFWIAHPDFVRIGVALVEAWRRFERSSDDPSLWTLVDALVPDEVERAPLLAFLRGGDAPGLSPEDPLYVRGVLAANVQMSDVIANHDPVEVRYNIFQALQYLADWLGGNGCVALPATLRSARGDRVPVRIMDDLATTERSRWELWAEVHHGRVSVTDFDALLAGEVAFLQADRDMPEHRIHVRWQGDAARWYPIAVRLLRQLVVADDPPEFVTELALPFTFPAIRDADDPWAAANELCPGRFDDLG